MKLTKNVLKKLIKEEVMQEESGNIVYIVIYKVERDCREVEAVFSTKEKAEAYIQEEAEDPRRPMTRDYDFEIETYEIDRYA